MSQGRSPEYSPIETFEESMRRYRSAMEAGEFTPKKRPASLERPSNPGIQYMNVDGLLYTVLPGSRHWHRMVRVYGSEGLLYTLG